MFCRTEPQLKKLEREYAELKGELSTLRNAVQLVTDLKDLKQKYVNVRKENPQEKTVVSTCLMPYAVFHYLGRAIAAVVLGSWVGGRIHGRETTPNPVVLILKGFIVVVTFNLPPAPNSVLLQPFLL